MRVSAANVSARFRSEECRAYAMTRNVADHQPQRAVATGQIIKKIAAGRFGRDADPGDIKSFDCGGRRGKQVLLNVASHLERALQL